MPQGLPSSAEDFAAWQLVLSKQLKDLLQEAFENRTALAHFIQHMPRHEGDKAIEQVTLAIQLAVNTTTSEAELKARELMQPGEPNFTGARDTCILMWSFGDQSLCRALATIRRSRVCHAA